jgi:hypothetical protein
MLTLWKLLVGRIDAGDKGFSPIAIITVIPPDIPKHY